MRSGYINDIIVRPDGTAEARVLFDSPSGGRVTVWGPAEFDSREAAEKAIGFLQEFQCAWCGRRGFDVENPFCSEVAKSPVGEAALRGFYQRLGMSEPDHPCRPHIKTHIDL